MPTPATIGKISTPDELEQLGRLRYRITVEEMGLPMIHADHRRRTVLEPLDHHAHLFGAWRDGEMVGTMRSNLLDEGPLGDYYQDYDIPGVQARWPDARISITTRLAFLPEHRDADCVLALLRAVYTEGLERGISHDVADCRAPLLPLFLGMGYRPHRQGWRHPEFGEVTVVVLDLNDREHLASVGSPLLAGQDAVPLSD